MEGCHAEAVVLGCMMLIWPHCITQQAAVRTLTADPAVAGTPGASHTCLGQLPYELAVCLT